MAVYKQEDAAVSSYSSYLLWRNLVNLMAQLVDRGTVLMNNVLATSTSCSRAYCKDLYSIFLYCEQLQRIRRQKAFLCTGRDEAVRA